MNRRIRFDLNPDEANSNTSTSYTVSLLNIMAPFDPSPQARRYTYPRMYFASDQNIVSSTAPG